MLKKVIIFAVLSAFLFSSFSLSVYASEHNFPDDNIESYYLFDFNHNITMANKNTDLLISPSSTTKIMTACLVLESGIDLSSEIKVTSKMLSGVSGRSMYLKEGNVLTVEDLLYAMICGGYNDATHILALTVSPSINEFTEKMNTKAKELGMNNTHYKNPTGMTHDNMKTTVDDIYKLVRHIIQNEYFLSICSTKSYNLSSNSICNFKTIKNRSSLINEYQGIISINVGSSDSGDCTVFIYQTSELELMSIVMNAKNDALDSNTNYAETFSKSLIDHALNNYSSKLIKLNSETITSLPVKYSISSKDINVYLQDDLKVFLPNDVSIDDLNYSVYITNNELIAPLKDGDIVGTLNVFYDGLIISTVPLVVRETVDKNIFLYSMDLIKQFILSKTFLISIIMFILLLMIYFRSKKRKYKRKKSKYKKRKKPT